MEDKIIFKNLKIDFKKLQQLGFVKENDYYIYETKIMDNQFSLIIKIDKNNIVRSDVVDLSENEKLTLYYIAGSKGKFIGRIREEYDNIIEKIKITCCSKYIFKSQYANLIIEYIKQKYNDDLVNEFGDIIFDNGSYKFMTFDGEEVILEIIADEILEVDR